MFQQSPMRQKALLAAQSRYRRANLHPSTATWRAECITAYGFYDGTTQWLPSDLETLRQRRQNGLTVNMIQGRIDSLSGVEIQSRFRNAFRSHSQNPKDELLSTAITHHSYFFQEDQDIATKDSVKFRDMMVCGIGWSDTYKESGRFFYEWVHPFNMIPDPDDLSPQFTNMQYVCRKRWMEPNTVKLIWPKTSKLIDFTDQSLVDSYYSPELMDRMSNYTDYSNSGYNHSRLLVIEVQHKEPKKAYCGVDSNGNYFETFNLDRAEELVESENDIQEKDSKQIMRTIFLNDYLLEYGPLKPSIPDMRDFSYVPCVWKRRFKTGVPYGILDCMKDLQRDANVRLTKSLYLANSSRLIVNGELSIGQTPEDLESQLKKVDSVIMLPNDTKFDLRSNTPDSEFHLKILEKYDLLLQRASGIYDDMLGQQTNATSGVAQRERQVNSVRNNVFAFDNFANMRKREGRVYLDMLQGDDDENIFVQILNQEETESIVLNMVRTVKGKKYVFNDIRTFPMSIYVEEVPDFNSFADEQLSDIERIMNNPNAAMILQSPTLLKMYKVRNYKEVSQEISQAMQQQQLMKNGAAQPQAQPLTEGPNMLQANGPQ